MPPHCFVVAETEQLVTRVKEEIMEKREMTREGEIEARFAGTTEEKEGHSAVSRRSFVAGATLLGASMLGLGLTGCAAKEAPMASTGAKPEELGPVTDANLTPGTYTGEAAGHRGTIRVSVTVSENSIDAVEFLECVPRTNQVLMDSFDNPSYVPDFLDPGAHSPQSMLSDTTQVINTVIDRLGDRIVEAQSTQVDAVSGATSSSFGYLNAVRDALSQAGGNPDAFERAVPKKTDSETYDVDVVVVGAGGSGCTAAAAATKEGAKVLLMEKSARIGGCAAFSNGGHFKNSKLQVEAGFENHDVDTYFTEGMKQGQWCPKGLIIRQYSDHGGEAIDLLDEMGSFEFVPSPTEVGYSENSLYFSSPSEGWYSIADAIDTVLLETTATELIVDGGSVVGVRAERYDGTQIAVNAKAVVMATGGFMGNADMMREYNHTPLSTAFSLAQDVGEGLQMMWSIGAHQYHTGGMNAHITQPTGEVAGFDDYSAMIPYTLHATSSFLRVNQRGERFYDENVMEDEGMVPYGNCIASQGRFYYVIVSQDQMNILKEQGLLGVNQTLPPTNANFRFFPLPADYAMENIDEVMEAGVEQGGIYKGATFEELADAAGFDPARFATHAANYEEMCQAGEDTLFYKDPARLIPMGSGPYYAIQAEVCPYSTMGGIEIDESFQVLDDDAKVIPGLYSAGVECIGTMYNGAAYSDLGGLPFSWAVYSGYAAGRSAAGNPVA